MKVLLIDDEADIRRIAGLGLSKVGGLDVVESSSGLAGIEAARREFPDVILLDVVMPDLDGPQTLERLDADERLSKIPVVFLTASSEPEEVERLRATSAIGVITKPFDPMRLAARVRELMDER